MRSVRLAVVVVLLGSLARMPAASAAGIGRIDPSIARVFRLGFGSPAAAAADIHPGRAEVLVELNHPITTSDLARLAATGAEIDLPYDRYVPATVDARSLAAIAALSDVVHVGAAPSFGNAPMDASAELIGLAAARGARPALDLLTGEGMLLGDTDSNADIYHPHFFKGDAGYFDWIDTNGDGVFAAGVDGIDLDRDGQAAGGAEVARVLLAQTIDDYDGGVVAGRPSPTFDPAIDWMWLDTNGNHIRDFGPDKGFDDSTPAFGEPLFVPDDVNRNGKLDVGERLVRLGTSKFRAVFVRLSRAGKTFRQTFTRGVDLTQLKLSYAEDTGSEYNQALHATAVLSIAVGDLPLVGRRWVGVAPDAEIALAWDRTSGKLPGTTWLLEQHPDVMLYESAQWTNVPLDGGDELAKLIDASAVKDKVTHACPTGNIGGSDKHMHAIVPAGKTADFNVYVPTFGGRKLTSFAVTLNVRGAPKVTAKLKDPTGVAQDLAAGGTYASGAELFSTELSTARGTYLVDGLVYTADKVKMPIATGSWTLHVVGDAEKDATVDGFISDDISVFAHGVGWDASVSTDASTMSLPSTADHCISVGAFPAHPSQPDVPWWSNGAPLTVYDYSGRGPRIDGELKIDVIAPANPWAAAARGPYVDGGADVFLGSMLPFSGTSGATPHVAALGLLLAQADIRGDDARAAVQKGAIADDITGKVPNGDYGFGRLSAAGAFGVSPDGVAPTVELALAPGETAIVGKPVHLVTTTTTATEMKWDDGYDGTWDIPYAPIATRTLAAATKVGSEVYKVRVRDAAGRIAEAILRVTWSEPPPAPPPAADAKGCSCDVVGDATGSGGVGEILILGLGIAYARRRRAEPPAIAAV